MPKRTYQTNFGAATDDAFAAITTAHQGLSEEQSHALNARLVLLMANEIGDLRAITDLCETARTYVD